MEIMSSDTYSNTAAENMQDPHPEVELAPQLRFEPIAGPRPMSPIWNPEDPRPSSRSKSQARPRTASTSLSISAKRESYDLTGSTFLVTNDGRTLKLPVASESKNDPLNWSRMKTAGAIFAIALFSVVCLTAAQAASVVLDGIQLSFEHEVCPSLPILTTLF